jgi:hypothetical protein
MRKQFDPSVERERQHGNRKDDCACAIKLEGHIETAINHP